MRIGIVCYPTYGGSGVLATELGIGLANSGHEVHFISYKRPARLTTFIRNVYLHEVGNYDYPLFEHPPYDSLLASKIVNVAQHADLDLPFVTTLHGTDITLVGIDSSLSSVVEFSINQSDRVTTVSKSLRDQTRDYFNTQKEISVIYNFINLERFSRKMNPQHRAAIAPKGEKIMVHVSNFRTVKRVEDVVV